jgi:hypothetical protein
VVGGQVVTGFDDPTGGTVVRVQGDDGKYYYYAHLSAVASGLEVGDRVDVGQVIGAVGNTGDAAGGPTHLHLGIYVDGKAVDPYPLLAEPRLPDFEDGSDDLSPDATALVQADGGDDPFRTDAGHHSDHDGVTDEFEKLLGTDLHRSDSDRDGRTDYQESVVDHTDPLSAGDGQGADLAPAAATGHWRIPLAALEAGFGGGAAVDSDKDGLSDLSEVRVLHTDPFKADSDGDRVSDGVEHRIGSDPLDIDTDRDGVTDDHELAGGTLEPMADLSDLPDPGH